MPIYEYRCRECRKKTTFITLSVKSAFETKCTHCGSPAVDKLVSRVAIFRSEESRLENLADPSNLTGLDESDPKSVARWMKKMGKEMGEDVGEDFEREIDQAVEESERSGETGDEDSSPAGPGGAADETDF